MFGIIYLMIALWLGAEVTGSLLKKTKKETECNHIWIYGAGSFGCGVLITTWMVYGAAWMFHVWGKISRPLLPANLLVLLLCIILTVVLKYHRKKQESREKQGDFPLIAHKSRFKKEAIFYGILLLFVVFTMFYVFYEKDGVLFSGFTVFGDYAPHTAMMRSFSKLANFPTQYPHFGGEDVKYHFMFQFLVGNLEYLGLRIDVAYNLVSSLALTGFLIFLSQIAIRISGRFLSGIIVCILFFFRSGTAFWQYLAEHWKAGDLGTALASNRSFLGYTPKEDWGLWNYNVYLNQRHLAFGLLISGLLVWFFLERLEQSEEDGRKENWLIRRWGSRSAWKCQNLAGALLGGILLGMTAFWNGAAEIGCLLILFGFAVFCDGKLDFLITAVSSVAVSFLQTKLFIHGSGVSAGFYWGFIAEDKTILGILWYLFQITGITVLGMWILLVFLQRKERILVASFCMPLLFAFVGSLTPDITVNHKYIMITMAYMGILWGIILVKLLAEAWWKKILGVILLLLLTANGIYDFTVIMKGNDSFHRVQVNMESSLTRWLDETLTEEDLILTPEYSMNEVTISGVMMYCGWPYYAWSAGYDTYYRAGQAVLIYTTEDEQELRSIVEKENIDYILFEEGMTFEERDGKEELIARVYPLVFTSEDGRIRIYETKQK